MRWHLISIVHECGQRFLRAFICLRYIQRMGIRSTLPKILVTTALTSAAILACWPAALSAAPSNRVRCESKDGRWQYCRLPEGRGEVAMLRQLSRNACIRNHSWGVDDKGIWVARGCRAEFGREAAAQLSGAATKKRLIRCESTGMGQHHCPISLTGSVRLTRQLSKVDCELGESWGYDAEGVWVSQGCRAEFEVEKLPPRAGNFISRLFRGDGSSEPGITMGRPLRCESIDGARKECRAGGSAERVELVRQLSHAKCVVDDNWGWTKDTVWVSGGCRAEFLLW